MFQQVSETAVNKFSRLFSSSRWWRWCNWRRWMVVVAVEQVVLGFFDPSIIQSGPGAPLNAPAGITVTAQGYPITVGGGGSRTSRMFSSKWR